MIQLNLGGGVLCRLNAVADIQRCSCWVTAGDSDAFTQPINGVLQLNGVPANNSQRLSFVNNQPGTDYGCG